MLILNIYVSSNLVFVIKSYEPEKFALFWKIGEKIAPSHSEYQRTL